MKTKNYFERENSMDWQYFCQLQVSEKFRRSMNAAEMELCDWMVQHLVHHTVTEADIYAVVKLVQLRIDAVNDRWDGQSPFLVMMYVPLRTSESGYIRIERANRKHQSLLLPIIDCRGNVVLESAK